jgi:pimeloyl-ACP methyl ester carboxylesterase
MKIIKTNSFQVAANITGDEAATQLAVLMPGRLDTKDYINFKVHADLLSELGFLVVAIDPPGTWESPGSLENYTTSMYVNCINELIEHFGNRPTLLLGHSRGGATAMVASSNPHVSGLVCINAAYGNPSAPDPEKIVDGVLPESRDLPPGDTRTEEQVMINLPLAYFEDGKNHDPAKSLAEFKGPKLIVHATEDEFKPLADVKEIFKDLNDPKMFLEINCKHDYRLYPDVMDQVNKSLSSYINTYEL